MNETLLFALYRAYVATLCYNAIGQIRMNLARIEGDDYVLSMNVDTDEGEDCTFLFRGMNGCGPEHTLTGAAKYLSETVAKNVALEGAKK